MIAEDSELMLEQKMNVRRHITASVDANTDYERIRYKKNCIQQFIVENKREAIDKGFKEILEQYFKQVKGTDIYIYQNEQEDNEVYIFLQISALF